MATELGKEVATCSAVSRHAGEDAIGTAVANDAYLMVELPLPWAPEAIDSRHVPAELREVLMQAAEQGVDVRFQAFTADQSPSPAGKRRVMYFSKPAEAFARYNKQEYLISENDLPTLAAALLQHPDRLERFADSRVEDAASRDVFVCVHGSRDFCCGSLGYPLFDAIARDYAAPSGGALRVWRVSHLGGHRFAPTLVDFPEGRYWARVGPANLAAIVGRSGTFSEVARLYRGWCGVGKIAQVLEREILLREGWRWTDWKKSGAVVGEEAGGALRVRFKYASGNGSGVYEGIVELSGSVMTGGCQAKPKEVPQYTARITSHTHG